jgi:hypothetical protein
MNKFTPGPWNETRDGIRASAGYVCLLSAKPSHYQGQDKRYSEELEERAANARLIAAAPELYSLATHITAMSNDAYLEGHPEWNTIVDEAYEVLAKIEGV